MRIVLKAAIILAFCLSGCVVNQTRTELSHQVHVFGIEMNSDTDYQELRGVQAREEPCLKGYERNFDAHDISIVYGFNGKIRKITSRNPETDIFGISPGMTASEGKRYAQLAGFTVISAHRYQGTNHTLILLIDDNDRIFGVILEMRE